MAISETVSSDATPASKQCVICGDEFTPDGRRTSRCGKEHYRTCEVCGDSFIIGPNVPPAALATKRYCSKKCSAQARSKPVQEARSKRRCGQCGAPVTGGRAAKYCSRACADASRRAHVAATTKTCEACGATFIPTSTTSKFCDAAHKHPCEVCGEAFVYDPRGGGSARTCSYKCRGVLVNTVESLAKRQATSLERYGTLSPSQTEEVKAKARKTFQEKYGAKGTLGSPVLQAKVLATMKKRYGVEWSLQSEELMAKASATNLERYGSPNVFLLSEFQAKAKATYAERLAKGEVG